MFFTKPGRYRVFVFDVKRMAVFTVILISSIAGILWANKPSDSDYSDIVSQTKQLAVKLEELSVKDEENLSRIRLLTDQIKDLNESLKNNEEILQGEVTKLKELNEILRDRTRLLGILQNENNAAILAGRPQDIIFIGRNWTISYMPRYLNMSIQDVEWLGRFVNKEEGSAVAPPTPNVPN